MLDRSWYTIKVFDRQGAYLEKFGRQGSGPGELQFPTALAVDPVTDEILVRESVNGNTHLFSPSGEYLKTLHPQLQGGLTANEILLLRVTRAGIPVLSNFNLIPSRPGGRVRPGVHRSRLRPVRTGGTGHRPAAARTQEGVISFPRRSPPAPAARFAG